MSYTKTTWANNDVITAAGLNNIENGVFNNDAAIATLNTRVNGIESSKKKIITGTLDGVTGYVTIDDQRTVEDVYDLGENYSVEMIVPYTTGAYHFILANAVKTPVEGGYSYSATFICIVNDTHNTLLVLSYDSTASAELVSQEIGAGDSVIVPCETDGDDVTITGYTLETFYALCKTKQVILMAELGPDTEHNDEYTVIIAPITSARKWTSSGTHYSFIASSLTAAITLSVLSCLAVTFNDSLTGSLGMGTIAITPST